MKHPLSRDRRERVVAQLCTARNAAAAAQSESRNQQVSASISKRRARPAGGETASSAATLGRDISTSPEKSTAGTEVQAIGPAARSSDSLGNSTAPLHRQSQAHFGEGRCDSSSVGVPGQCSQQDDLANLVPLAQQPPAQPSEQR